MHYKISWASSAITQIKKQFLRYYGWLTLSNEAPGSGTYGLRVCQWNPSNSCKPTANLSTSPPCDSALRLIYFYNDWGFKCNSIHSFLLSFSSWILPHKTTPTSCLKDEKSTLWRRSRFQISVGLKPISDRLLFHLLNLGIIVSFIESCGVLKHPWNEGMIYQIMISCVSWIQR